MAIVRTAACVRLLAKMLICIYDVSLISAYSASQPYYAKDLANPEVSTTLAPRINDMIKAEEKRRALEKDREEAARKMRVL